MTTPIIDQEWLDRNQACASGVRWLKANTGIGATAVQILKDLKEQKQWEYFRWLARRVITKPQAVEWAIFSAEKALDIYEREYPADDRPRKAIEAAKESLRNPSEAAAEAAYAAYAAAEAAYAADAAAYAAYAAAYAAYAAYTADAANAGYAVNAAYAASCAARAADAADAEVWNRCADKAIELIEGTNQ